MPDLFINGIGLTIIDQGGWADYEWAEFTVMRGDDGELYVGGTSGCSCENFAMNLSSDDLIPVSSWQDAAAEAQIWAQHDQEERGNSVMTLIERLTQSRPVCYDPTADTR